jgi:hypothetical protein
MIRALILWLLLGYHPVLSKKEMIKRNKIKRALAEQVRPLSNALPYSSICAFSRPSTASSSTSQLC